MNEKTLKLELLSFYYSYFIIYEYKGLLNS